MSAAISDCFLCKPDRRLVYMRSQSFFAMLGHGPLGRGYSLIASAGHVPSMFDLEHDEAEELAEFTERVRARLRPFFGPAVVTEHGRVAACVAAATRRYEPHCLHAHRLVFPGLQRLDFGPALPDQSVEEYPSFLAALKAFEWEGQYLYAEADDGACGVARAPRRLPRQFFRTLVAAERGEPELASWQAAPRLDEVEAARRELGLP